MASNPGNDFYPGESDREEPAIRLVSLWIPIDAEGARRPDPWLPGNQSCTLSTLQTLRRPDGNQLPLWRCRWRGIVLFYCIEPALSNHWC